MNPKLRFFACHSSLGWMGVLHEDMVLVKLKFGQSDFSDLAAEFSLLLPQTPRLNSDEDKLAQKLVSFAAGNKVTFDEYQVRISELSCFQQQALDACRTIPFGETRSYSDVAEQIGSPKAFRAVGMAMKRNPVPLIIPCHRVISTSGRCGGFSAGNGTTTKQKLLDMENPDPWLFQ